MSNILDLDKLIPEKRTVILAGEEIDVSKIPSRVTMEVAEKANVFQEGGNESFPMLLDIIVKICKPSKPDITQEWIVDNTSMDQLLALVEFVLKPLKDKAEGNEGTGKNEQSPNQ